jgi:type VI secretion system protein ImpL
MEDIQIKPINTVQDAEQISAVLSGTEQPLQSMIKAIKTNLNLTKLPKSDQVKNMASAVNQSGLVRDRSRLSRLLPEVSVSKTNMPGAEVEAVFTPILDLQTSQLAALTSALQQWHQHLKQLSIPSQMPLNAYQNQLKSLSGKGAIAGIYQEQKVLPVPLSTWLSPLTMQTQQLYAEGARRHLNNLWRSQIYADYKQALEGRYPLNAHSKKDAKIKDFESFFGYGGELDVFFKTNLAPFVDTRHRVWRFTKSIGISNHSLAIFQRAEQIRKAYFKPGSKKLAVRFALRPVALDTRIASFMFEMDGQQLYYRHGPTRLTYFNWPGENGDGQTRFVFTPPDQGLPVSTSYEGPWSFFKLVDRATRAHPLAKKDHVLVLASQGNIAKLKLVPDSVINPFWTRTWEGFTCPPQI